MYTLGDNAICGIAISPISSHDSTRLILASDWDSTYLMDSTQVGVVKKQFNFASSRFSKYVQSAFVRFVPIVIDFFSISSKCIIGLDRDTSSTVIFDSETCMQMISLVDPAQIMSVCALFFTKNILLISRNAPPSFLMTMSLF
jgi:hypothetical protein